MLRLERSGRRTGDWPSITQDGSDNFRSGVSGKLPKIATSNVIISRSADRIAAKFRMKI